MLTTTPAATRPALRSVELFAGAGGLGLGLAEAGFHHELVAERNHVACETLRANKARQHIHVKDWPIHEIDVRDLDLSLPGPELDLLSGGPPCQPFSIGGKKQGNLDDRDMFPWTVKAVRSLAPKAFLLENVRGITGPKFTDYLRYIVLRLSYPEMEPDVDQTWSDHLARLEAYDRIGRPNSLFYRVRYTVANAADYGVPQHRHRVFIVGVRGDLAQEWRFPEPTHCAESLDHDKWISGAYWERHGIAPHARPNSPVGARARIERLRRASRGLFPLAAHGTVRDALQGLPEPTEMDAAGFENHRIERPDARAYPGHTGSPIDEPSKALKAGDHGVPGGENMIDFGNGRYRHFTTREAARIQTFPDSYVFPNSGGWSEALRQLGNAVPVRLSRCIGNQLATMLQAA